MNSTEHSITEIMAEFQKACRAADLKLTHQRLEVYRELVQSEDHPSAEILYNRILEKLPTISLDTIYRTLATLEKHGLITRVQTVESQARFEAKTARHHHAICNKCKEITDFTWDAFDNIPIPATLSNWGNIAKRSAVVKGTCTTCSAKN